MQENQKGNTLALQLKYSKVIIIKLALLIAMKRPPFLPIVPLNMICVPM